MVKYSQIPEEIFEYLLVETLLNFLKIQGPRRSAIDIFNAYLLRSFKWRKLLYSNYFRGICKCEAKLRNVPLYFVFLEMNNPVNTALEG